MLPIALFLSGAAFVAVWIFMRCLARHCAAHSAPYDWADDEVFGRQK